MITLFTDETTTAFPAHPAAMRVYMLYVVTTLTIATGVTILAVLYLRRILRKNQETNEDTKKLLKAVAGKLDDYLTVVRGMVKVAEDQERTAYRQTRVAEDAAVAAKEVAEATKAAAVPTESGENLPVVTLPNAPAVIIKQSEGMGGPAPLG